MSVLSDDLYLENIEEYVKDERRVVTCKWLSRKLSVPMNAAKKMLYHYVSKQATPTSLSVLYCVTGKKQDSETSIKSISVQIVPYDELEAVKSQFVDLWTVHVYSVQLSPIKESAILYDSDYQMSMDYLNEYSKWNAISCNQVSCDLASQRDRVAIRETVLSDVWSLDMCKQEDIGTSHPVSGTTQTTKLVKKDPGNKKKQPLSKSKGPVTSFFNKKQSESGKPASNSISTNSGTSGSSTSLGTSDTSLGTSDTKTLTTERNSIKQEDAVRQNIPDSKQDSLESDAKVVSSGLLRDSDFEDSSSEDTKPVPQTSTSAPKKSAKVSKKMSTTASKQSQPESRQQGRSGNGSKEGSSNGKKKRRRVHGMYSSDEDNDDDTHQQQKPVVTEKPSNVSVKVPDSAPSTSTSGHVKKRKMKRKLVSKMFVNEEDGSMVTQKKWETVSTDASSGNDEEPQTTTATTSSLLKMSKTEIQSPSKRTKQSTLTSFFKK